MVLGKSNRYYWPLFYATEGLWRYFGNRRGIARKAIFTRAEIAYVEGGNVRKAVTEISGMFHLLGEDVVVLADGNVVSGKTVSATGGITLDRKASKVHIGKRFISDIETLDVEAPEGTIHSFKRKVTHVTLRMQESRGLLVGPGSDKLREMKFREFEKMSDPTDLFSGDKTITIEPDWGSNGRLFIRQIFPLPMTILAVIPKLDIGES